MSDPQYILGVDVGGTKVAVGLVSLDGKQVRSARMPTNAQTEGPDRILPRMVSLCRQVIDESGVPRGSIVAGGVGCVGPLDPETGEVLNPGNLPGWVRVPLARTLSEGVGVPFFLDNDANAAAIGEHRFGAGRGVRHMVYLTISTGIGGGVIIDDRIYRGQNGNAGEIGHMSVNYQGRRCACGNLGCIEAYASGTNIAARAREAIAAGGASSLAGMAGGLEQVSGEHVVRAVRDGDALAKRVWDETLAILGSALASVIHIFNPRRIVLGGGVTNAGEALFFEPLREQAKRFTLKPMYEVCDIVAAQLGGDVGVMGAAAVGIDGWSRRVQQ